MVIRDHAEELKACPFCGNKAELKQKRRIGHHVIWCECTKCHARTSGYHPDLYDEGVSVEDVEQFINLAMKEWNIRV